MAECMSCGRDIGSRGYRPNRPGLDNAIIARAGSLLRIGNVHRPLLCMNCAVMAEHTSRTRLIIATTSLALLAAGVWAIYYTGFDRTLRARFAPASLAAQNPLPQTDPQYCPPDQAGTAALGVDGGAGGGANGGAAGGDAGGAMAAGEAPAAGPGGTPGGAASAAARQAGMAANAAGDAPVDTAPAAVVPVAQGGPASEGIGARPGHGACRVRDWRPLLRDETRKLPEMAE